MLQGATLTADEAACGFDSTCIYRIPIKASSSHLNFIPCTMYNVSIEVKSYEVIYCFEPPTITRMFKTNTRGKSLNTSRNDQDMLYIVL